MKPVKIYTTPYCAFCVRAKRLLDRKKVPYEEIDVAGDSGAREPVERPACDRACQCGLVVRQVAEARRRRLHAEADCRTGVNDEIRSE